MNKLLYHLSKSILNGSSSTSDSMWEIDFIELLQNYFIQICSLKHTLLTYGSHGTLS